MSERKPLSQRKITVLDAPSNLGLRPPTEGVVPGCYKLPWALRDRNLMQRLQQADDAGAVVPPRYRPEWKAGDGSRNADAIAGYSLQLADRLEKLLNQADFTLVLGGDCSILIGNMLALKRRGRYGLAFLDAHSDFRHLGNAPAICAAAGEDLAIVTGRGDKRLIHLEQHGPYVRKEDVHVVGVRPDDAYLDELTAYDVRFTTSTELLKTGAELGAAAALNTVTRSTQGFWVHLDLDIIDSSEMQAVDCPEPNGVSFSELSTLLCGLLSSPRCLGMEVTIFDPDLDPSGVTAERIVGCLQEALRPE